MLIALFLIGNFGTTEILLVGLIPLLLIVAVVRRLFRSPKPTVIVQQSNGSTSLADELRKLEELRDRGSLTPAEFNAQKAKLLR